MLKLVCEKSLRAHSHAYEFNQMAYSMQLNSSDDLQTECVHICSLNDALAESFPFRHSPLQQSNRPTERTIVSQFLECHFYSHLELMMSSTHKPSWNVFFHNISMIGKDWTLNRQQQIVEQATTNRWSNGFIRSVFYLHRFDVKTRKPTLLMKFAHYASRRKRNPWEFVVPM